MDSQGSQISSAALNKDYQKLEALMKQLPDVEVEIYNCLFDICEQEEIDARVFGIFVNNAKIDINYRNGNGEAILHVLSRRGHFQEVKRIIQKRFKVKIDAKCHKRKTPLLLAAENGHLDILKLLESCGADISHRDGVENCAIHLAAANGRLNCIEYLIEKKFVHVNITNKYKDTPLHKAADNGQGLCVDYLLKRGADVHLTDVDGQSALFKSAFMGDSQGLEILLKHGSDVNLQDAYGFCPFMSAAYNGHLQCMKLLLSAEPRIDVNRKDLKGNSALSWSAGRGHADVVAFLLKAKANVNSQTLTGVTPLMWAARLGHLTCVQQLIEAGANIDLTDDYGGTALMKAALYGCVDVVRFLRDSGANRGLRNNANKTAFYLATKYEIKELLR